MARGSGISSATTMVSRSSLRDKYNGPFKQTIEKLKAKHPEVEIWLYGSEEAGGLMTLDSIKAKQQGSGLGSNAMKDICALADKEQRILALTPSDVWGANQKRLVAFYKRYGFVENKGKRKDFEITSGMYRLPN